MKCPLCGNVMLHKETDGFHTWMCLEPHTREQWTSYVKESGDETAAEDQESPPEGSGG